MAVNEISISRQHKKQVGCFNIYGHKCICTYKKLIELIEILLNNASYLQPFFCCSSPPEFKPEFILNNHIMSHHSQLL